MILWMDIGVNSDVSPIHNCRSSGCGGAKVGVGGGKVGVLFQSSESWARCQDLLGDDSWGSSDSFLDFLDLRIFLCVAVSFIRRISCPVAARKKSGRATPTLSGKCMPPPWSGRQTGFFRADGLVDVGRSAGGGAPTVKEKLRCCLPPFFHGGGRVVPGGVDLGGGKGRLDGCVEYVCMEMGFMVSTPGRAGAFVCLFCAGR